MYSCLASIRHTVTNLDSVKSDRLCLDVAPSYNCDSLEFKQTAMPPAMSQTISELQAQVATISAEIKALEGSREALRQEQLSFQAVVSFPRDSSSKALAEFQQQQATLAAQRVERLKEIDRSLKALDRDIKQKQAFLASKQEVLAPLLAQQLEERLQTEGRNLQAQAQKINQLAEQLEAQLRVLKAMYIEINPLYCEWLQKPAHIVDFSAKTIPYVFVDSNGFGLRNKPIDWEGDTQKPE